MRAVGIRRLGWLGLVTAVALLAGCTSGGSETVTVTVAAPGQSAAVVAPGLGDTTASSAAPSSTSGTTVAEHGVRITSKPKFGTKNIAPNDPVTITVFSAKIQTMAVTADDGTVIAGTIAPDKATWTSTERLDYATTYTFDGVAQATSDGASVPIKGTLATVKPKKTLGVQINIPNNGVVGIAAPIIITFLGQVADRAAAEKALTVTTSAGDKVEGNWGWVQDEDFQSLGYKQSQVHWRPTKSSGASGGAPYWPASTKVTVTANLKGVNYGNGLWGREDLVSKFSIRPDAQIVQADASTFHLIVLVNDKVVKNWPVSYGKESVPGRATVTGIHVVTNKYPLFAMCNPQFDYCNAQEKWAVRINNNGEFIHENLKAAPFFGIANVSHGCINMGTQAAIDYYNSAKYGDPVVVTNTGGPAMTEKDALYDWIYSADDWKALSALS